MKLLAKTMEVDVSFEDMSRQRDMSKLYDPEKYKFITRNYLAGILE